MSATDLLGGYAPADEVALARLRRVLSAQFREIRLLDAHLALLDRRGVTYATHAADAWRSDSIDMFFGIVRHVIRTQCDGPTPTPDIEGWIAAGRPGDRDLGDAWDRINLCRYGTGPHAAPARAAVVDPEITALDEVIRRWPAHIGSFATAYARVERFIETSSITLPPLTA
jgi:hypothetical protein